MGRVLETTSRVTTTFSYTRKPVSIVLVDILIVGALLAGCSLPGKWWIRVCLAAISLVLFSFIHKVEKGLKIENKWATLSGFHILNQWVVRGENDRVSEVLYAVDEFFSEQESFSGMIFEKLVISYESEFVVREQKEEQNRAVEIEEKKPLQASP